MASVTFDPALGGDGSTVTDDADPTTGLANGGHRTRFVPALAQAVVMAGTAKSKAAESADSASTASTKASEAGQSAQSATSSAATATDKASEAEQSAQSAAASAGTATTKAGEASQSADDANAARLGAQAIYGDVAAVEQAAQDATSAAGSATDAAGTAEQSAQSAASDSQNATYQATQAATAAGAARVSETQAADHASTAQQARDAALTSKAIYTDTASGLGQTPSGEHFSVPSPDGDEYLILYLNNGRVAEEKKRYPSTLALEGIALQIMQLLQQVVATNDLAAQAAREVPDSRMLEQLVQAVIAAQDLAAQAARMVSGGEIELRDGSAALPALAHHGDRDTGLYFPAADALAVAVAGLEALRIDPNGRLGIGTTSPSSKLDVDDDRLRLRQAHTPASATDSGAQGDIAWDANHFYICTATNTWKRAALSSW